ncbi:uncharacterized protein B0I36DRAFT_30276 [Microdochium trichocladiopsis]|uniref:Zn(2)-C6 fungal-type domain-containing protein n=1 Tax=Microdochium trichocladiopsis TaxID=1682393 RepID=A0A9P8XY90_9PEZI|nr:uncharacterized protein B0I36DRAFT_30276 [Microdochium trichocladiopsis]KAH7021225.1 hypothetical protein B0I36DRAFT_30276 [Microdochium trichocladiopsis]
MDFFRASTSPAPQKRASKPKVRTGCARCKQRHIKCDEARPACSTCSKSSADCQYIILERKKQVRRSKPRASEQSRPLATIQPVQRNHVELVGVPRGVGFGPRTTAIEAAYFDQFRLIANVELAHPDLWGRAMLRESMRDDGVRHGLMALGALSKALHGNPDPSVRRLNLTAPGFLANTHYQAAVLHYTTSLRLLRKSLAQDGVTRNPRGVLLTTFIFINFESMLDNASAVDILLANAVHVLSSHLVCFNRKGNRIAANVDDEGIAIAEYLLPRRASMSALSIPLYPTMKRVPFPVYSTPPTMDIPQTSQSMRALRLVWDKASTYYALWMLRCTQAEEEGIPIDPKRFAWQQSVIITNLNYWEGTMKKILAAETDPAKRRSLMLSLVAIQTLLGMVLCFADPTMMAWDAHTPLFSEALDFVESAMAIPRSQSGKNDEHIFDDSIVPAVEYLSQKCREKGLRRRCQDLREMLGRAAHKCGSTSKEKTVRLSIGILVAVEEAGRDGNGFLPMESRYSWTGATWNNDRTELTVKLTGTTYNLDGTKAQKSVVYHPPLDTAAAPVGSRRLEARPREITLVDSRNSSWP